MTPPHVLIEQWLPIAELGVEAQRENSARLKPPLNWLHVWWARRPLTVCRAAVLASLLPAYPADADARAEQLRKLREQARKLKELGN